LRLADLGLVPGAEFDVVREAPFGDPIEIALNGVRMAVRRKDAQAIWVKTLADS
jgi:ferrous iron transport protein A